MAKGKKQFKIETPKGAVYTQTLRNGKTKAELEWKPGFAPKKKEDFTKAQEFVDSECIRKMNPDTPRRTGVLVKSATLGTAIGSGEINQIAPYARKQYYGHKRNSYWFERMKNRDKDTILRGAANFVKSH